MDETDDDIKYDHNITTGPNQIKTLRTPIATRPLSVSSDSTIPDQNVIQKEVKNEPPFTRPSLLISPHSSDYEHDME